MGRSSRTFVSLTASPARPPEALRRQLACRRRAIRALGLHAPPRLADGPPDTLARRIARLDRWIARELDLAGGKRFGAREEEDDDEHDPVPRFRSR